MDGYCQMYTTYPTTCRTESAAKETSPIGHGLVQRASPLHGPDRGTRFKESKEPQPRGPKKETTWDPPCVGDLLATLEIASYLVL